MATALCVLTVRVGRRVNNSVNNRNPGHSRGKKSDRYRKVYGMRTMRFFTCAGRSTRASESCIKAGPREEEYNFEKQKRKNWERGYLGMKKQNQ